MNSMIISAIVGFAALNINGVSGAVVPAKAIKRFESSGSHSEATGNLHSAIVKRDTAATGGISTVNVPVTIYPYSSDKITKDTADDTDSAATTCVHTTQGFIQCGEVISKRDTDDTPIENDDDGNSTDSTAITCVRTTEGLIQCGNVISKRDTVSTPSINNLSKRVKMKRTSHSNPSPIAQLHTNLNLLQKVSRISPTSVRLKDITGFRNPIRDTVGSSTT
ncbi:MAG: hypothetical protein Q9188_002418 [Gyalolechia gomerana]